MAGAPPALADDPRPRSATAGKVQQQIEVNRHKSIPNRPIVQRVVHISSLGQKRLHRLSQWHLKSTKARGRHVNKRYIAAEEKNGVIGTHVYGREISTMYAA